MQKSPIVGIALVLASAIAPDRNTVVLPRGRPVMVDGKVSPGEWTDASRMEMPQGAHLYLKQADGYVYLCVELPAGESGFVDLYLSPGDTRIYDLHASAKLGQRLVSDGPPTEWKNWWNNEGWVANVSRVDSFDQKRFLPENVREFQLDSSSFSGQEWRIMVEVSLARGEEYTTFRFPEKADKSRPEGWIPIRLR